MTAQIDGDERSCKVPAGDSSNTHEEVDQAEEHPAAVPTVTRVPLHGPVDTYDVMCAKVIFALCGSVFPHPLLLAQQLLGIEDQDYPEFQVNVAEAGNNCIDIVAAYLTNLRVMQQEEEPNPPISIAMVQPRHAATVASVAAKARDLLSELALARATVKPRKAPKNKAIESAARAAAAAAASSPTLTSTSASSAAVSSASNCVEGGSLTSSDVTAFSEAPSDTVVAFGEDLLGSESNDDDSTCGGIGHQDTSRESNTPRTAREDEERLLYALQGPAAAEETLKMARAKPSGCKNSLPPSAGGARANTVATDVSLNSVPHTSSPSAASAPASSPRAFVQPPPPPPSRTPVGGMQQAASSSSPPGAGGLAAAAAAAQRLSHDSMQTRNAGSGGRKSGSGSNSTTGGLQTALSCPVSGLTTEMLPLAPASPASSTGPGTANTAVNHHQQQPCNQQQAGHGHSHRRNAGHMQNGPGNTTGGSGGGRRNNNGAGPRNALSTLPVNSVQHLQQQQQQHHHQQQHLALAQLLGMRQSYGSNAYGNPLLSAYGNALSAFNQSGASAAAAGRLDLNLNSVAATTAALELAAAQQVAAMNGIAHLAPHLAYGAPTGAAGFGAAQTAGSMQGLAGQLAGLGGLSNSALLAAHNHQQHSAAQQQQQQAAAAAALLQQGGGMLLAESLKGAAAGLSGAEACWSSVLLQAQLAGQLS